MRCVPPRQLTFNCRIQDYGAEARFLLFWRAPGKSPRLMPIRMLIPLIVACGLFMENLNSTVLSTSLPAIAATCMSPPSRSNSR